MNAYAPASSIGWLDFEAVASERVSTLLRKTLAAYRLAFGQPRQGELVEFLGDNFSDEELGRLCIDLSPPE